ncbi:50S ribosomal protein L37ae [Candidatus Parcubacteria bacterium]|nr:MAG: 50S ribosomal protein L37ae [Candidatus Parcubacteria bacterium]
MVDYRVRGGAKLRKQFARVQKAKRAKYECAACSKKSVRRKSAGVWECRSCGAVFAGGAYELSTPAGRLAKRLISDLRKGAAISEEELERIEQEVESAEEE